MRPLAVLSAALVMAGCSSYQIDDITPVPAERLMKFQDAAAGTGELRVNRDVGYLGGGCFVEFRIDRETVARVGRGESASFHVPAGPHIVGIGVDEAGEGLCANGRLNREDLVEVKPGMRHTFRIVSEASSGFDIRPDDSDK